MRDDFSLAPAQIETAVRELRECAALQKAHGLSLSETEMRELAAERAGALSAAGRVEFGGGILPKLIYAFSDSPYVERESWADTLSELQEAFYYYKTESADRISDDELIDFMVKVFNGRAQGSTEYLSGTSLAELCRYARQDWDERDAGEAGDLF